MKTICKRNKRLNVIKKLILLVLTVIELVFFGIGVYLVFVGNVLDYSLIEKILLCVSFLIGIAGVNFVANRILEHILPYTREYKTQMQAKYPSDTSAPQDQAHAEAIDNGRTCKHCDSYEPFYDGPIPRGDGICRIWNLEEMGFMGPKEFKVKDTSTCDKFRKKETSSDAHFKK